MRSQKEILSLIEELTNGIETIKKNRHKYVDKDVPNEIIEENLTRIHTLEWVLGQHDRFD